MKKTLLKLTPIALAITTLTACSPASETAKTAPEPIKTEQPAGQSESERLNAFFELTETTRGMNKKERREFLTAEH